MRYDTPIYFISEGDSIYDVSTGDYIKGEPVKIPQYASVNDTTTESMTLIYGKLKQGSLTIQLQNHYNDSFSWIEVAGKRYAVDRSRKLRTKHTFIVSEVQ